jgi:plasmid stabilization system protein ParE
MKVVVTQTAYDDLAQIGRAIANDDPLRAESFVAELFERCRRLAAMPRRDGKIAAFAAGPSATI